MGSQGGRQVGGSSGEDYIEDTTAKHFLDSIGKKVHDKVKEEAEKRSNGDLKGLLTSATLSGGELAGFSEPCGLIKNEGDKLAARGDPCKKDGTGKDVERFSDKQQAEYDNKKMKCSNSEGACAPFRRLYLCNKNFQKINNYSSNAKHNLLLDVCLAAKYEGDSLKHYSEKLNLTYTDSPSQLCTELARSFADIGDIIRGKDLYLGNKKKKQKETERDQLESKLKEVFGNIYEGLTNGAQKHYNDDTTDFLKLREDWWALNRDHVWKAITCGADAGNKYFRGTCGGDEKTGTLTPSQCRCNDDQVPTYFDYVPQFLRWFEEWAEDFCRKRKHKLQNAKEQCRGVNESGQPKYCSRNGYDCEKTKRAIGKYRMGNQCTKCLFACNPYVEWIDNQRKQFDKQKKKYDEEMQKYTNGAVGSGSRRQKRGVRSNNNYEGYEKIFYDKLKKHGYEGVDKFLEKLSNEEVCKKVQDTEGGRINFKQVNSGSASDSGTNDINNGTFYRSDYCQPCPHCGVERKGSGWKKKSDSEQCKNINLYRPKGGAAHTDITILKSGEGEKDIAEKLNKFCTKTQSATGSGNGVVASVASGDKNGGSGSQELYEEWKCYEEQDIENDGQDDYEVDVKGSGGICILEKTNGEENGKKQKTYNDFFNFWVAHMLKDSIHWRTKKIKGCLSNGAKIRCNKKNKCKTDCGCFQKWVEQKGKEWKNIKIHFAKQDMGENELFGHFGHDYVLEGVLQIEFLNEDSAQDTQNSLDAEEIKHLKHLREMLQKENAQGTPGDGGTGVVSGTGKKTIMDKLIEHEEGEAENCKKCEDPPPVIPAGNGGPARILPGRTTNQEDDVLSASEDEEDDEGDEDVDEPQAEEDMDGEATEEAEPDVKKDDVNVCETVAEALKVENLTKACSLKYGPKAPTSWKCVTPSGDTTGKSDASGSICIPPRRRRLYIQKIQDWATKAESPQGGGEAQTQSSSNTTVNGASPSDPRDDAALREAFIKSAAIETFFLWDRYKKIKDKERQEKEKREREESGLLFGTGTSVGMKALHHNGGSPQHPGAGSDDSDPQTSLQKGHIPPDFLRLMFYTLGDYRDILFSGSNNNNIVLEASGSTEQEKEKMNKIQQKIDKILKQSGEQTRDKPGQEPSDNPRVKWWNNNAQHIWHGMICALTYKENGSDKPQVDVKVKEAFFGENNRVTPGKPSIPLGNSGTYESTYKYENVVLKEDDSGTGGPRSNSLTSTSGDNNPPKLSDFVLSPPYFRYLEEWGQNFCKERKKRLEEVRKACREKHNGDDKFCSGDGEDCNDNLLKNYTTVSDFDCPSCGKHCGLYKRWIKTKKEEFIKQSNAYKEQQKKFQTENKVAHGDKDNKQFCGTLENLSEAKDFLQNLGGCSKNNSGEDNIDFGDKTKTFGPATNCAPCSQFKVKCNGNDHCDTTKGEGCENKTYITADDIKNNKDSAEDIGMLVSDDSTNAFEGDGLRDACGSADIFKGFREDVWTCGNVCGYNVCKPKNVKGKTFDAKKKGEKQIIIIRALFKRWLEYFLQDYNKIKHKISHCINKGNGSPCINRCVEKWINTKKEEWKKIKDHYKKHNQDNDMTSLVKNFLRDVQPQTDVNKAIKPCGDLKAFEDSSHCNGTAGSKKSEEEKKKDVVLCLIEKLEKEATSCKDKNSDKTQTACENSTPLEDDDEPFEEEENPEENTVAYPKICEGVIQTQTPEEKEDGCKPAPTEPDQGEQDTEVKPLAPTPPEEKAPVEPPPPPAVPPSTPSIPQPLPSDNTSDILKTTIPFGIALALTSIALLFLKKKTKSSVGNLFQILQIPKSDHDIPTLKSSNRYIPYASDRYKGKTYIYIEGDSSGDEKYAFMSDTTDVTSSESEYEELDVNDIYVPGSPKYKTLIEVVLEPSKRDIQSNDIPNNDTPMNKFTDEEWNQLKHDFISNMLQNTQNTEPNILGDNVDNNTNPKTLHVSMEEKPFIMSIHDRNLYIGEEYSYDMSTNSGNNDLYNDNHDSHSGTKDPYSGTDLINDALSGNKHIDIYDELLKRKENELFGTNHTKQNTSTNNVAKNTNSDPILNQINLFHKWLDRHRHMCDQWDKNKKEELLDKLKKEWNKENNTNSSLTHTSNIPSGENSIKNVLNTDVSIQIDMDNPKPKNEFTNMDTIPDKSTMDTILDDLEKYNEPYYYDFYKDDIYYDVNDDDKTSMDDIYVDHNNVTSNNMDVPTKMHIEMNIVNNKNEIFEEEYPISDIWNI
ncbi:hypothetical protein PFNF135_01544 [Plasmodium falciparum NF135/5.C10]|uniref:Erythrocyte membrane protein 1 n=1 Tax=Plasmodium falciparum NF135/5.C10 TaxID=1036726 RepID=W4ILF7_PLAFA|nr:hypothetical protein PFNF135_01544 [Plasmodium falciparum NF135/5.C10]